MTTSARDGFGEPTQALFEGQTEPGAIESRGQADAHQPTAAGSPSPPAPGPEPREPEPTQRRRGPPGWLLIAALLFSGSFQAVMSAPANWWPLAPFYLVPGLWAIGRLRGRRALLGGWLLGFTANVTIFYWIVHTVQEFSNLPTYAAVGLLGLFGVAFGAYAALFGWGYRAVRSAGGAYWPFAVACLWVACEFLNPQLFPYYQGVVFYQVPIVFLVTAITGVPGVSFQMLVWNLFFAWLLERRLAGEPLLDAKVRRVAVITLALLALTIAYSAARLSSIDAAERNAETRRLAMVQINLDVHDRRDLFRKGRTAVTDLYIDLCEAALAQDPEIDAFIWPEGALPATPQSSSNRRVMDFVRDHHVEIWTGGGGRGTRSDGTEGSFNAAYRLFGNAEVDERYEKNILLPFGEFMPLMSVFPILGQIRGVGRYIHGEDLVVYNTSKARFCFLICYEAIRHAFVRRGLQRDVDLLVNITYDAWFGDTTCPDQHLMLSAIQSAQYGVPLVRSATTGISAVVDARGMITHRTPVFEPAVLVADVPRVHVPSIYTQVGDLFAWSCVVIAAALVVFGRFSLRIEERG